MNFGETLAKSTSLLCILGLVGLGLGSLLIYKIYNCLWLDDDTAPQDNKNLKKSRKDSEDKKKRRKYNDFKKYRQKYLYHLRYKMGNVQHNGYSGNVSYNGINGVQFLDPTFRTFEDGGFEVLSRSYLGNDQVRHRSQVQNSSGKKYAANGTASSCVHHTNRQFVETSCLFQHGGTHTSNIRTLPKENDRFSLSHCSVHNTEAKHIINDGDDCAKKVFNGKGNGENLNSDSVVSVHNNKSFRNSSIGSFSNSESSSSDTTLCKNHSQRCSTPLDLDMKENTADEIDTYSMIANFSPCSLSERNFRIAEDGATGKLSSTDQPCNNTSLVLDEFSIINNENVTGESVHLNSGISCDSGLESSNWELVERSASKSESDKYDAFKTLVASGEGKICDNSSDTCDLEKSVNNSINVKILPEVSQNCDTKAELGTYAHMSSTDDNTENVQFKCDHKCTCVRRKSSGTGHLINDYKGHRRSASGHSDYSSSREGSVQRELDEYERVKKVEELREDAFSSQTSSTHSSPYRQRLLEQLGYASDNSDNSPLSPKTLKEIFAKKDWSAFSFDIAEQSGAENVTPSESDIECGVNRIDNLLTELEDLKNEMCVINSKFVQLTSREYVGELYRTTDPYPISFSRRSSTSSEKDSPVRAHQILKKYKIKSPHSPRSQQYFSSPSPTKVQSPNSERKYSSLEWDTNDDFHNICLTNDVMTMSLSGKSDSGVSSVFSSNSHSKVASPEFDDPGDTFQFTHHPRLSCASNSVSGSHVSLIPDEEKSFFDMENNDFLQQVKTISQNVSNLIKKDLNLSDSESCGNTNLTEDNVQMLEASNIAKPQNDDVSGHHGNDKSKDVLCTDESAIQECNINISLPAAMSTTSSETVINNIGNKFGVLDYVTLEWKGTTKQATKIRQGYSEINSIGFHHIRRIRGDNYCAIRATLFQALVNNLEILNSIGSLATVKQVLLSQFEDQHQYLRKWSFASRLRCHQEDVLEVMVQCLESFYSMVEKVISQSDYILREKMVLGMFSSDYLDIRLMEAVKILMMMKSIELFEQNSQGKDVPVFVWLMFARDTSENPEKFLVNHINPVGDSGGLEQVEMFLLAHCLGVGIQVMRPSQFGEYDFVTYFPEDAKEQGLPVVHLIAEDDRHYNVALK